MRHKTSRFVVALASASMLALAVPAFAYGPPGGGWGGPPDHPGFDQLGGLERRIQRLDLDQATRKAAFAIIDGARAQTRDLQDAVRTEHERMRKLMDQDKPDKDAVMAQVDRISAATSALRKHELSTLLAVFAVLTPEQRAQLRPEPPGRNPPPCRGGGGRGGMR
jgi:Spy/CpxP family protein refolding chaperone